MPLQISPKIRAASARAQAALSETFARIDAVAAANTEKVLAAFRRHRVAEGDFAGSTGYGYGDTGRDKLEAIYADIFGAQAALARVGLVSGTHALACALFGTLRPGDTLLSAMGTPYDTLLGVIGVNGRGAGSLAEYGVHYRQVEPGRGGRPDLPALLAAAAAPTVKAVLIQRSGGYSNRPALSVSEIGALCAAVREVNPAAALIVDNCYGEFVEEREPTEVGADLAVGSFIKNPGGGLAPTGGYVIGRRDLVDAAAMRLTAPGIGAECGPSLGLNRLLYQGLFLAPHTVAQALKTAAFAAALMGDMGYQTDPAPDAVRHDIIQKIHLGSGDAVRKFCLGIQSGAPVDSYATPEPWDMPGYDCPVIMAAGAFVQGASIELSADAPMREPYTAFLQGGLTYESGKAGLMLAAEQLIQ